MVGIIDMSKIKIVFEFVIDYLVRLVDIFRKSLVIRYEKNDGRSI